MDALDIVAPLPRLGESLIDHIRRLSGEERETAASHHSAHDKGKVWKPRKIVKTSTGACPMPPKRKINRYIDREY